jgi:hypothetical protein
MVSSGILRRVAPVRTDVSEERSASFIRVARIGELGPTLAPITSILVTPMKEALSSPKRQFLQEPHGVTSQKTPFFRFIHVLGFSQDSSFGRVAHLDNNNDNRSTG